MWTSGAVGVFKAVPNTEERLRNFSYSRKGIHYASEEEFQLKSAIRLDRPFFTISKMNKLLSGVVLDEHIFAPERLVEYKDGRYDVGEGKPQVVLRYGKFWLTTQSIAIAEKNATRDFTFTTISKALKTNVRHIRLKVNEIARDYSGHWINGFSGRTGLLQSGTLYGDSLEREPLTRAEYQGWDKRQVGFVTRYFGAATKVKVTANGTVIVYKNLWRDMELFIRFIRDELLGYSA